MIVLGIDVGTSALKAVLVDAGQRSLADVSVALRTSAPRPGWSEQDPADWWTALETALAKISQAAPDAWRDVRAIGLSGQMHGSVVLDRDSRSIRPTILWNDGRATAECEELHDAVPELAEIAGIIAMPGFTAPKLLWLKRHEPENFARIAKILLPKDYLRFRLTGESATDMCDAAGTLVARRGARDWSDADPRRKRPRSVEDAATRGGKRSRAASFCPRSQCDSGFARPIDRRRRSGRCRSRGIGIGSVEDGDAFISLGTSAQFFVSDDRYRPQPGTLLHAFAHALPKRWFRMAAMLNGATCLDLVARVAGKDVATLLDAAEADYRGPSRLLFLPYLFGERTPHNDSFARGVFVGLDHDCGAVELTQAAMEGVAFSLLEARNLLELAGVELPSVAVVGGGARSRFWMQLLSHVLGLPVRAIATVEPDRRSAPRVWRAWH